MFRALSNYAADRHKKGVGSTIKRHYQSLLLDYEEVGLHAGAVGGVRGSVPWDGHRGHRGVNGGQAWRARRAVGGNASPGARPRGFACAARGQRGCRRRRQRARLVFLVRLSCRFPPIAARPPACIRRTCRHMQANLRDVTTGACARCGRGDDDGDDWIICDTCERWVHFHCDPQPHARERGAPRLRGVGRRRARHPRDARSVDRSAWMAPPPRAVTFRQYAEDASQKFVCASCTPKGAPALEPVTTEAAPQTVGPLAVDAPSLAPTVDAPSAARLEPAGSGGVAPKLEEDATPQLEPAASELAAPEAGVPEDVQRPGAETHVGPESLAGAGSPAVGPESLGGVESPAVGPGASSSQPAVEAARGGEGTSSPPVAVVEQGQADPDVPPPGIAVEEAALASSATQGPPPSGDAVAFEGAVGEAR